MPCLSKSHFLYKKKHSLVLDWWWFICNHQVLIRQHVGRFQDYTIIVHCVVEFLDVILVYSSIDFGKKIPPFIFCPKSSRTFRIRTPLSLIKKLLLSLHPASKFFVKSEFSNGCTVWLSWHLRIPLELLLHEERGASPGGVEEVNI